VPAVDDSTRQLLDDMLETMYAAEGIGLAATQVNAHLRVIVIDVSETKDALQVFINPEIESASDERIEGDEGCLSVPGIYDDIERPGRITVRAVNARGETFELEAEGLLAVCIQHEMDHLQGKVFVQYLSRLKQSRIKSKMAKLDRQAA
jgi:peptide deformylase